jgi:hypothetical protein
MKCKTVSSSSMLILTDYTDLLLKHHIFIWMVTASLRYNLLATKHVPKKPKWLIWFCWVTPWQWEIQSWGKFCLTEPEPHHRHNKNLTLTLSWLFHVQPISPTPFRQIILEKPTVIQLVKKLPAFYRTKKFITTFSRDLSQLDSVHIIITCSIFTVVIFSHLCLGQPSCFFLMRVFD